MNRTTDNRMSFNAAWSMAVGGMIGGGIFSVLGVVIERSAEWAWLSFVIAGIIALISAYSYTALSISFGESGGSFLFLRKDGFESYAASLSWVLILGYILTISVYAFTFGHYIANVTSLGPWFPRLLGPGVIALLAAINLRGVGNASTLEIITVWGKLLILIGLALFGLYQWEPEALSAGIDPGSWSSAILGAATIFMAYEGFQLLSYDYDDIREVKKKLYPIMLSAVAAVILIYVIVTLGATMLVGAESLVEQKEVALAVAGREAFGTIGLILVTIAAAFSTASAINATLFSTGRLMESVAHEHDLPTSLGVENSSSIPARAILLLAGLAALLSAIGSLSTLVDTASLIFLITFGTVNLIAFQRKVRFRYVSLIGAIGSLAAIIVSSIEQIEKAPVPFGVTLALVVATVVFRKKILQLIR